MPIQTTIQQRPARKPRTETTSLKSEAECGAHELLGQVLLREVLEAEGGEGLYLSLLTGLDHHLQLRLPLLVARHDCAGSSDRLRAGADTSEETARYPLSRCAAALETAGGWYLAEDNRPQKIVWCLQSSFIMVLPTLQSDSVIASRHWSGIPYFSMSEGRTPSQWMFGVVRFSESYAML